MVFLVATAEEDGGQIAQDRARGIRDEIGRHLVESDQELFSSAVLSYRSSLTDLDNKAKDAAAIPSEIFDNKQALVTATIGNLKTGLTPLGYEKLLIYVRNEKKRMGLFPFPAMNPQQGVLRKPFLLAQSLRYDLSRSDLL